MSEVSHISRSFPSIAPHSNDRTTYNEGTCDPDGLRYAWLNIAYQANGQTVHMRGLIVGREKHGTSSPQPWDEDYDKWWEMPWYEREKWRKQ